MALFNQVDLSPGPKVNRVSTEPALGKRWVPQFAFGQIFNQKAGKETVCFLGVNKFIHGIVNPHFAQRYSVDQHGAPRKRLYEIGILA